jgi:Domain of unknown function (DUF4114)
MKKLATFLALALVNTAFASTDSPVQSAVRPYGLDIADEVQLAGSDAAAQDFQANVLPGMISVMNSRLNEYSVAQSFSSIALDPSKLVLGYDTNLRVYFVGEGAGYYNTLGFATTGGGVQASDAELVFPNASSNSGYGGNNSLVRTSSNPLQPGDFVDLGTYSAGTQLNFFLIADGASGGSNVYSTDKTQNRDGIVHAVSLAQDGSAYLLIGFEDLYGGGDKDYNDLVFAVYLGRANVEHLQNIAAPEPSMAIGSAFACLSLVGFTRRRQAA